MAGPGYTTSNLGVVSVSGQTITVSGLTRTAAQTVVITYGSGATATAAAGPGAQTWQINQASTVGGVLTAIAASPSITLYAPDGSGTATTPTTNVSASQTGNTVVFTYTVAAGDMSNGQRQADDPDRLERAVDAPRRWRVHDVERRAPLTTAAQVVTITRRHADGRARR